MPPIPSAIPMRPFGRHSDVQVSALALGGHHLGDAPDLAAALRIIHEALDGGINFFDNCWEYHLGKTEDWLGQGLKGRRNQAFLMTKVCTHGRDADLAMKMLEQSLNRLQTDHLDLWQIHGVAFDNDPARLPSFRRIREESGWSPISAPRCLESAAMSISVFGRSRNIGPDGRPSARCRTALWP